VSSRCPFAGQLRSGLGGLEFAIADVSNALVSQAMTILLIENHEDTASYIKRFLEQLGHGVAVASDSASAAQITDLDRFDVILSDIGLPDGDGWALMQQIRAKTRAYAIAMSGFGTSADVARSYSVGYQDHLTKPFTPIKLQQALQKALENPISQQG
jgi:CheY-like chemotaxis protein